MSFYVKGSLSPSLSGMMGGLCMRATLYHIMGIPFQGHHWEDDTKVPLSRGDTNDNDNHNNRDTLQYKSTG